jgi:hypothetical protein
MFKEFFKKVYKSKKSLTQQEVEDLETEQQVLRDEITIRQKQIDKFKKLISEDFSNESRYNNRMSVHIGIVAKHNKRLDEIEIKLLDK